MTIFWIIVASVALIIAVLFDLTVNGWHHPLSKGRTFYRIYEEETASYLEYRTRVYLFNFIPLWKSWHRVYDKYRKYEDTFRIGGGAQYIQSSIRNNEYLKEWTKKYPNVSEWYKEREAHLDELKCVYEQEQKEQKEHEEQWPKIHIIRWFDK